MTMIGSIAVPSWYSLASVDQDRGACWIRIQTTSSSTDHIRGWHICIYLGMRVSLSTYVAGHLSVLSLTLPSRHNASYIPFPIYLVWNLLRASQWSGLNWTISLNCLFPTYAPLCLHPWPTASYFYLIMLHRHGKLSKGYQTVGNGRSR